MSPKPRNAGGEPLGPELLELVQRLAHADELDGLARDLLDGERGAAAGVPVQLGENEAGEIQPPIELGRRPHRVLADHRVGHQQDVLGRDPRLELLQLAHHLFVDGEAAGGIVEHDVAVLLPGVRQGVLRHVRRLDVLLVEDFDVQLLPELLQLLHRGGTVDVRRHHQRLLAALEQEVRELGDGGGLSGALQADHHHPRRPLPLLRQRQRGVDRAHQRFQLVVADLDEVVARRDLQLLAFLVGDAGRHHLTEGLLLHPGEETLGDVELDVRLQQRDADVAQGVVDVRFRQLGLAGELVLGGAEALGDCVEHAMLLERGRVLT